MRNDQEEQAFLLAVKLASETTDPSDSDFFHAVFFRLRVIFRNWKLGTPSPDDVSTRLQNWIKEST